ncbi:myelin-associated glycoprotein-like [Ambystoma mexicanum]|uniref:myelin-associated glycoprotein-like n=1 Tax=Ambystoma mexicanum TaxID=8296 RepID=UPI0037E795DE
MGLVSLLVLTLLCKGFLCALEDYKMYLSNRFVTPQRGLCVFVGCEFTYDTSTGESNANARGCWRRDGDWSQAVASQCYDPSQIRDDARGRFQFLGDVRSRNCSLRINDVKQTDGGNYVFRYEHSEWSGVRFNYRQLNVQVLDLRDKPEMFLPRRLVEGQEVNVTCTAPGRCSGTAPKITWTTSLMSPYSEIQISINNTDGTKTHISSINFQVSKTHDRHQLMCDVRFPAVGETTTNYVTLENIEYAPVQPAINASIKGGVLTSSVVMLEGSDLVLLCTADSNPPSNLTWTIGETILTVSNTPSNSLQLDLFNITSSSDGSYHCEAINEHGQGNNSISVTVQYPPRMLKIHVENDKNSGNNVSIQRILEGKTLSMNCSVESSPHANLTWIKEGKVIVNQSQNKSLILTLQNVSPKEDGQYWCAAKNEHGMLNASILISVEYKPRIAAEHNSSCKNESDMIICMCVVQAMPPAGITWTVNKNKLAANFQNQTLMQSFSMNGVITNSTLTLKVKDTSSIDVSCQFSNEHGSAEQILQNHSGVLPSKPSMMPMIGGVLGAVLIVLGIGLLGWLLIRMDRRKKEGNKSDDGKEEVLDDDTPIYSEVHKPPKGPIAAGGPQVDKMANSGNGAINSKEDDVYENFTDDSLQYASIDFSKIKPRGSPSIPLEETLYSEVKLQ